jgi:beta-lactamase regulating signal transducer with metallopeptidase domain
MRFLIDFGLPALVLSSAALVALRLIGETSIRFRTTLALIGVLAWFIPWHLVTLPVFTQAPLPLTQWIDSTSIAIDNGAGSASVPATEAPSAVLTGPWWLLLFVPGGLLFPFDLVRRARGLRSLERQSRDGEPLRSLLPDSLQLVTARIRIIPGANAMATGVFRGTIWVGEDLCSHSDLKTALVHECCHLKRKDALLILAVHLVRCLYCWNPVVLLLSGHLQCLIEPACDAESAAVLARVNYKRGLARLMVDTRASYVALVSMVMGASRDSRRIRALESEPASALRRFNAIVLMLVACLLALSMNAQQRDPRIGEWREDRDSPNYVGLYMIYEELANGMTRTHTAENLAPQNRLHRDSRCDGNLYPSVDSAGAPTGTSFSCTIVDANTLAIRWIRDVDGEWAEGEGTWTLSSDGNHFTTVVEVKDWDDNVIQTNERRFTRNAENCLNHADEELFRECQRRTRPRRN